MSYDSAGTCPGSTTSYNTGRLIGVSSAALGALPLISESMLYDALGRVCSSSESVGSGAGAVAPGMFSYGYNLASGLSSEIYPSGRTINVSFDVLNRPIGVNTATTTYANLTNTYYASNDALGQLQLGPAAGPLATQAFTYDSLRQQPTEIKTTNGAGTTTLLDLTYGYCPSGNCAKNNGNVQSAGITIPGVLALTQNFGYDLVNRVCSAAESGGSVPEWNQCYGYDAYGNRVVLSPSNYIPNTQQTPQATGTTACVQTVGSMPFTNNQWMWTTPAPYDGNGNLTSLPMRTFSYDAENRMTGTSQPGMGAISYTYDGNGRRVQKSVGGVVTTFIYDGGGQLAAEYSTGAATATGTEYLLADALGSTRLVLDETGAVKERLDYLPFGEEIPVGVGGRTTQLLYSTRSYPSGADVDALKFTSKERDAETAGTPHRCSKRSCVLALHIDRDRLSRHGSRLLDAGELSQRQTWASRFSSAPALRLLPTVKPSLIHAAVVSPNRGGR